MTLYEKTWQAVRERIASAAVAAGRDPASVSILAVSKTQPPEAIRAAHGLGQRAFGENYVQEALDKMRALDALPDLEWHLIGPLQGNKARAAAAHFAWVQSVDRLAIAHRLSAARAEGRGALNVCVQVNISGEPSKSGCVPGEALDLAHAVAQLPRLAFRGFMGIAAETADAALQRAQFRGLRLLQDRAREAGLVADTLSMGMTADLESAIAEGATMVRIGSALFGPRLPRRIGKVGAGMSDTGDSGND
ncbi:MAG: YggS family pyridoxal phosphate-dependent enzyme [Betaproteobacteria bacterium]